MSGSPKIYSYKTLDNLVTNRLRNDLNDCDLILLFAYNGTGKTRLSMEFRQKDKKNKNRDTLYFNAFTEDLFYWDNDLEADSNRVLHFRESHFFDGLEELEMESRIAEYLNRYADFDFKIDYKNRTVTFSKQELVLNHRTEEKNLQLVDNIKVSRGEENIFIWCFFLAVARLAIEKQEAYAWVKYLYIDDPISSLDDNNAIAVASDLAQLLKSSDNNIKTVISSHHGLFFNVLHNEFRSSKKFKSYFYHRPNNENVYTLRTTEDTPFFHHVSILSELKKACESGQLFTYHFNMLRSIMEKTATFFGYKDFSVCIKGIDDEVLYSRALNLLSHGKYSIYEPKQMVEDTKKLFSDMLNAFLDRYKFELPKIIKEK
ncbi:AAA family ATPase [Francisella hispaniensis]|uniref:Anticodon nuclease n=1 Tax=Francisella hispaniensis FSC454 TaxID=1088883 RepID=A0AAC9NN14_9GAMM|nr:AAA family ATPase [Francisella hispaniensis]APD49945.1 anticodon nuclease [Francisella hispaniensis FSC454]KYW86266.1 anticodon nuclease [Francisella hispaniensis FSC454]